MSDYLAFDLGAESGRALVGRLANGKLTLQERHRFANPNSRINGHLHWNMMSQWEELKTGLRKSADTKLAGIGVDTWGVDFGLLGQNNEILGNPFHYRDARTDGMMEKAFTRVSKEEIFKSTGIQFMQLNSLFQLFSMRESNSSLLAAAEKLLFVPDLFNFLFTGVSKSEFSIASTSQMYDPVNKRWATTMLEKLGLPTKILPEIVPSGTVLGPLLADVAKECGVEQIPVIAPACHDTGSAVAAVPAEGNDWCYLSSGTWSLMGVEIDKAIINEKSLKYNYTNEGGVGGTIRFLKNIMGLWLIQECRRQWRRDGREFSYTELTNMARESKPFAAIADPDHAPFGSPGDMPEKIAEFCRQTKQTIPENPGEFVRASLEGLAMKYRMTLEGLEDVLGRNLKVIHIVGGGGQNELLNQMTADACGRPVIAGPTEATAIGNILVQAMATGEVKSLADARAIIRASFDVKRFEPRETKQWDDAYARFRALTPSPSGRG